MAADPNDPNIAAETQYNAAKYGGYGSGVGGLLGMLLTGYQMARPHAPAANLAYGMWQAHNLQQYNQLAQAEKAKAALEKDSQQSAMGKDYADQGVPQRSYTDPATGKTAPVYFNSADYKQLGELYGNKQGLAGLAQGAQGKDPAFGSLTPMPQAQTWYNDNVMKPDQQSIQNTAFYNQINQKNPYSLSMPGASTNQVPQPQGLAAMQQPAIPGQGQQGVWDNTPTLTASATKDVLPTRQDLGVPSPMDRFTSGLYPADPKDVISGATQLNTAANDKTVNAETNRFHTLTTTETAKHNRADEGIGWKNAAAHMISAQKPPGGGGSQPSETTQLMGLADQMHLGPKERMQLLKDPKGFFGDATQKAMPPATLKALNEYKKTYQDNQPGQWFANPKAAQEAADNYNTLGAPYQKAITPFGGQSKAKLENVGAKYGVKY